MIDRLQITLEPKGCTNFKRRQFFLGPKAKRIGRALVKVKPASSNAIFDCAMISRIHACFVLENNMPYLKDLGSSNGTFLNGQPIHVIQEEGSSMVESSSKEGGLLFIKSGDVIEFGEDLMEQDKIISCVRAVVTVKYVRGSDVNHSLDMVVDDVNNALVGHNNDGDDSSHHKENLKDIQNKVAKTEETANNIAEINDLIRSLEKQSLDIGKLKQLGAQVMESNEAARLRKQVDEQNKVIDELKKSNEKFKSYEIEAQALERQIEEQNATIKELKVKEEMNNNNSNINKQPEPSIIEQPRVCDGNCDIGMECKDKIDILNEEVAHMSIVVERAETDIKQLLAEIDRLSKAANNFTNNLKENNAHIHIGPVSDERLNKEIEETVQPGHPTPMIDPPSCCIM